MRTAAWLAACIAGAFVLAGLSLRLPPALGSDTPAEVFSAGRAMAQIEAIARRPHPVGSPEHDRVRAFIASQMASLGLDVVEDAGMARGGKQASGAITLGHVRNIVATLPGRDRRLPALVLMAHYDSVPHSPGAADDGVGVAVLMETARAMAARGRPERDTIFLFTDAEEAGMLGAARFFASHDPARIMAVLNFEALGAGGRAVLFEASPGADALIAAYRAHAPLPASNSATARVYRAMPSDTDLSMAMDKDIAGLNIALIGRQSAYHNAAALPAAVDPRSVQHMGDQALALARALGGPAGDVAPAGGAVWFDLFGTLLVHYPAWLGWLPLLLSAGGLVAAAMRLRAGHGLSFRQSIAGALWLTGTAVALAAILYLAGEAAQRIALWRGAGSYALPSPLAGNAPWFFVGLSLLVMGVIALSSRFLPSSRHEVGWLGATVAGWTLAAGIQFFAPEFAWLPGWVMLAASLCLLLAVSKGGALRARLSVALLSTLALGFVLSAAALAMIGVGLSFPAVVALPLIAALPLLVPVLAGLRGMCRTSLAGFGLAGAGAAAIGAAALLPSPVPDGSEIFLLVDRIEGRASHASTMTVPDRWTRALLTAQGPLPHPTVGKPPVTRPFRLAPVAMPVTQAPQAELARAANGLRLTLRLTNGGNRLRVALRPSTTLRDVMADGLLLERSLPAGRWTTFDINAVQGGQALLDFAADAPGSMHVRLLEMDAPWPASAAPLPPRPNGIAPAGLSDRMMVLKQARLEWEL